MSRQIAEPEECLRSLTDEALRQAEGGSLVLHCTLGVRAAANALVLLGLLSERQADKILNEYQEALGARSLGTAWGLTDGELPVNSGAGDIWAAHVAGPQPVPGVPQVMAPAGVSFPATVSGLKADLRFDWVKRAGGQWRISFRASADDPGGEPDRPSVVMREALGFFTVTDDAGHRYRPRVEAVTWERTGAGRQEWRGELVSDALPDASSPASMTIASMESGTAATIPLAHGAASPAAVPQLAASPAAPRWPTPAEGYLAALAKVGRIRVGWTDVEADKTAEIVAIVADCLLAAGALPVASGLLRPARDAATEPWRDALAARWARRAHRQGTASAPGTRHQVLLAPLPLERASAVLETVSAARTSAGSLAGVALHGSPWVPAAPWPVITPCFTVQATDDDGRAYEGILEGFQPAGASPGSGAPGGRGTFWLWPPAPEGTTRLTITVSTLWEAATAEVTLPAPDGSE